MRNESMRVTSRRLAFVFAVLLSGCAGATRASAPDAAGAAMDARLLSMLDVRERDTLLIDQLLADRSSSRRARAALAIGQVRMRERYPQLRRLLVDADTAVAANAAFALGLAQDTASVVALARAFSGAPDAVAIEAAWSLGQIGEPARAVVALALGEGSGQPLVSSTAAQRAGDVRAELLMATIKIRSIEPQVLLPWMADTSIAVLRGVAYVMGRGRVAAGVRAMLGLRTHRDELVRQHVARVLARNAAGDSLATQARNALTDMLGDPSARVRANAARSLATYGPSVRATMERALRDPDPNVRIAAAEQIGVVLGTDAVAWRSAWDADTTFTYRRTLMTGARRAGTEALAGYEVVWQKHAEWTYRAAAVEARSATLANVASAARTDVLGWALDDVDGRVRAAAIGAIAGGQTPPTTDLVQRLQRALRDPDVQVRSAATSALARQASASGLSAVLDAYRLALADTDGDARASALRYIAAAWNRDSLQFDQATRSRLSQLAPLRDPLERAPVRSVTPMSAWAALGNTRTARPLAEYELIARRYLAPDVMQPTAIIRTERGDIRLMLHGQDAPLTVDAFTRLARQGFYRNTRFHRVVPNFVAQDGDPRGDGTGSAGVMIRDEHTRRRHLRGCLGVATSGPETGGSQFYMCHSPQPHLDGGYTVFGQVIDGFEVLDRIVQGDRVFAIEVR